jgi:hypothetical protein
MLFQKIIYMRIGSLLLIVLLNITYANAQNNDSVNYKTISKYCKVLGYLKYYHPCFTKGTMDWDAVFVEHYNTIKILKNSKDVDTYLLNMIDTINSSWKKNKINLPDKRNIEEEYALIKPLIEKFLVSDSLQIVLKIVFNHRSSNKQSFYCKASKIGNPIFDNEIAYGEMKHPNEAYRILAVARFWNIVNYYYPYKELTNITWDEILDSVIPIFIKAEGPIEYYKALSMMITHVNDAHCILNNPHMLNTNKRMFKLPIKAKFINRKLYVTEVDNSKQLAQQFEIGDEIVYIKNKSIDSNLILYQSYISASNTTTLERDVAIRLVWNNDSIAEVVIRRNEKVMTVNAIYYDPNVLDREFNIKMAECATDCIVSPNIAYIALDKLNIKNVKSTLNKYKKYKGLIFDLRSYPEFTLYRITNLLSSQKKKFVRFYSPNYNVPGTYIFDSYRTAGSKHKYGFKGKIAILVNENTQSRGEFTAMALQTLEHSKTIGSQTAGTDGDVSKIILPGAYVTWLTGLKVCYPDGTATQRIGVKIDIAVKPTIEGIKAGKDEVLESAINYINDGI